MIPVIVQEVVAGQIVSTAGVRLGAAKKSFPLMYRRVKVSMTLTCGIVKTSMVLQRITVQNVNFASRCQNLHCQSPPPMTPNLIMPQNGVQLYGR